MPKIYKSTPGIGYLDTRYLKLSGGTMTGGITNSTSVDPLTTLAESWIGPSSTTGIYFKGGFVGIGTTAPATALDVNGAISIASGNTLSWGGAYGVNKPSIAGASGTGSFLAFYPAGSSGEKVRIDNSGNVGIGTTGPASKLHITSSDANTFLRVGNSNRYRTDLVMNNAGSATLNSYDDTGAVYMPLQIDAIKTVLGMQGNVGIGTTSPTNILSLGGNAARIFWLERHTTANTAGNTLTITAGGATSGATDKAGGALLLQGGLSTGTGESGVSIYGCVAGATGTADRTQTLGIQLLGNKIGFYGQTATAQQTGVAVTASAIHAALVTLGLITA